VGVLFSGRSPLVGNGGSRTTPCHSRASSCRSRRSPRVQTCSAPPASAACRGVRACVRALYPWGCAGALTGRVSARCCCNDPFSWPRANPSAPRRRGPGGDAPTLRVCAVSSCAGTCVGTRSAFSAGKFGFAPVFCSCPPDHRASVGAARESPLYTTPRRAFALAYLSRTAQAHALLSARANPV
jgi:hypothetical protein